MTKRTFNNGEMNRKRKFQFQIQRLLQLEPDIAEIPASRRAANSWWFTPEFNAENFFENQVSAVFGDPGFGKSEFVEQLSLTKVARSFTITQLRFKDLNAAKLSKTIKAIESEKRKTLITLDGFDEIPLSQAIDMLAEFEGLCKRQQLVHLVVAARPSCFRPITTGLGRVKCISYLLAPLQDEQVQRVLENKGIEKSKARQLINNARLGAQVSVLQVPRYLSLFVTLYSEITFRKALESNTTSFRNLLFDRLVDKELNRVLSSQEVGKPELIRKLLERLALVMEIIEKNSLSRDELLSFFDEIDADIKLPVLADPRFLETAGKVLPTSGTEFEFLSADFQEFLAARELARFNRPDVILHELCVEPLTRSFRPSWLNTLTFFAEQHPNQTSQLVQSLLKGPQSADESVLRLFASIPTKHFSAQAKQELFWSVLSYYQRVLTWLDGDCADALSILVSNEIEEHLISEFIRSKAKPKDKTQQAVRESNILRLLAAIGETKEYSLTHTDEWRAWAVTRLYSDNKVVIRYSLHALETLGVESHLSLFLKIWDKGDELVDDAILDACLAINPNNQDSIKLVIKGLERDRGRALRNLYAITSVDKLKELLKGILKSHGAIDFLAHEHDYFAEERKTFLSFFERHGDDIEPEMVQLIMASALPLAHSHRKEGLLLQLIETFSRKRPRAAIVVVKDYLKLTESNSRWALSALLAIMSSKKNIKEIVLALLTDPEEGHRLLHSLNFDLARSGVKSKTSLLQHIPKPFRRPIKVIQQKRTEPPIIKGLPEDLKKPRWSPSIDFLEQFRGLHEIKLTSTVKQKVAARIKKAYLDKLDPSKHGFRWVTGGSSSRTWQINRGVPLFGIALDCYLKVGGDLKPLRQKLISYLPFAESNIAQKIIDELVPLTQSELTSFVNELIKDNGALLRHSTDQLSALAKKQSAKQMKELLEQIFTSPSFETYEKKRAVSLLAPEMKESELSELNKALGKDADSKEMTEYTNELLIIHHSNKDAVKWRLAQLQRKDRHLRGTQPRGWVGSGSFEMFEREYVRPFRSLKTDDFIQDFLELLACALDIAKDEAQIPYAQYLWETAIGYFKNIAGLPFTNVVEDVEKVFRKYQDSEGTNWFLRSFNELRAVFVRSSIRSTSLSEAVFRVNSLRNRQWLEVKSERDLLAITRQIISEKLPRWMLGEGTKLVNDALATKGKPETSLQSILKLALEKEFLSAGLAVISTSILREPQALDGKRPDFVISYANYGPIIVELKLGRHRDLGGKGMIENDSFASFRRYIQDFSAKSSILLVVSGDEPDKLTSKARQNIQATIDRIDGAQLIILDMLPIV